MLHFVTRVEHLLPAPFLPSIDWFIGFSSVVYVVWELIQSCNLRARIDLVGGSRGTFGRQIVNRHHHSFSVRSVDANQQSTPCFNLQIHDARFFSQTSLYTSSRLPSRRMHRHPGVFGWCLLLLLLLSHPIVLCSFATYCTVLLLARYDYCIEPSCSSVFRLSSVQIF
jgi:hypothetical protein